MKNIFIGLFVILSVLFLSGCSQKTELVIDKKPENQSIRYSKATVIVVEESIDSITEGNDDVIEDIQEEISEQLEEIGINSGNDLTIKIVIRYYRYYVANAQDFHRKIS